MRQLKPQKARGTSTDDIWDSPYWIAERKYDGFRMLAHLDGPATRFTAGRLNTEGLYTERTAQLPHLGQVKGTRAGGGEIPFFARRGPIVDTVLDGEIIVSPEYEKLLIKQGGAHSKAVGSIVNSEPVEAVAKQIERGWLRYVVFDCLFYRGQDVRGLDLLSRRDFVVDTLARWANPFVSYPQAVLGKKKREYYQKLVAQGHEGVVLKHLDHRYGDEKLWIKEKHSATADVVVMGFRAAREETKKKGDKEKTISKYAGQVGKIVCGQYRGVVRDRRAEDQLVEVAQVSGFDDALRIAFTENPSKFKGMVLAIEHNGREPTGRFRHPRFGHWRPDKNPQDCVIDMEER